MLIDYIYIGWFGHKISSMGEIACDGMKDCEETKYKQIQNYNFIVFSHSQFAYKFITNAMNIVVTTR